MKIWHLVLNTTRLSPGVPETAIVIEQDETKAFEAMCDPNPSPFAPQRYGLDRWFHPLRTPTIADYQIKSVGHSDRWTQESFSDDLRNPEKNAGPIYSADEKACLDFMADRIVVRSFTSGGFLSKFLFSFKLRLAALLKSIAAWLEENPIQKPEPTSSLVPQ